MARNTMENLRTTGDQTVKPVLDDGIREAEDIRSDIDSVKDQLEGMPELDPELTSAIESVGATAKDEARRDVERVMRDKIEVGRRNAENIKSQVDSNIRDNDTARGRLDSIRSKYASTEINTAKSAIDSNSQYGEMTKSDLDQALENAVSRVNDLLAGI